MKRRQFLLTMASGPLAMSIGGIAAGAESGKPLAEIRQNWAALLAPDAKVAVSTSPLEKSNAEWKQTLAAAQYDVLRQEGTERPFSSPLNDEKRAGVFVCAGCALPLFTSQMKFDSGTGWPSFFTTIPNRLATKEDFKLIMPRSEYHCVRCGGHQGHVFDDGPKPTGQRWCNNGVSLVFIPQTGKS
jgi:peptide-methionine (R)-S-oxide reductase